MTRITIPLQADRLRFFGKSENLAAVGERERDEVYWLRSHSIPLDRIYSGVIFLAIGALVLLLFFDIKARKEESWLNHKFSDYDADRSVVQIA